MELVTEALYEKIPYNLNAQSIKEKTPQIFDWLDLQDINVRVILILMLIVGGINMITALLILILERTKMIGILKALGANNWSVRRVFLYSAVHLILKGLFWGNFIGLGLALVQYYFKIIPLDQENYYMDFVPVYFDLRAIIGVNLLTCLLIGLSFFIPISIISRIQPVQTVRFD